MPHRRHGSSESKRPLLSGRVDTDRSCKTPYYGNGIEVWPAPYYDISDILTVDLQEVPLLTTLRTLLFGTVQLVFNAGLLEILHILWSLGIASGEPLTRGVTEDAHLQHHGYHWNHRCHHFCDHQNHQQFLSPQVNFHLKPNLHQCMTSSGTRAKIWS